MSYYRSRGVGIHQVHHGFVSDLNGGAYDHHREAACPPFPPARSMAPKGPSRNSQQEPPPTTVQVPDVMASKSSGADNSMVYYGCLPSEGGNCSSYSRKPPTGKEAMDNSSQPSLVTQPPLKNMKKPQKGKTPSRYKKKVQTDVQHKIPKGGNARTLERNVRALEDALNFLEMLIQPRQDSEEDTEPEPEKDIKACK